ncbi:helix-turn-helix domain-containing protein [Mycobacterium spongiae]|uniref:Helix-turn-helix domain-containing protein n=2 Tax=Mycobacterium spongiae TaxID=886343 RepID=A0A975PX90_9MYCO|nr:helix-turn-helix domain-containing protein [Mycobacterium spongiae]
MSQLMLAAEAQTTPRHISFLETGRSRPTGAMVIRLCDALGVQLRERNQLLLGAGLSPHYPEEPFDAPRYRPARAAINRLLSAHEPYAAVVLSRDWLVIEANRGAERLFGADLTGVNMMTWLYDRGDPHETIANWPEVARATVARLRAEVAQFPLDKSLSTALAAVQSSVGELDSAEATADLVVCPWFRTPDGIVRTMVLAARFDNAVDITLADLRVELIYPLDDEADAFFRATKNRPPPTSEPLGGP